MHLSVQTVWICFYFPDSQRRDKLLATLEARVHSSQLRHDELVLEEQRLRDECESIRQRVKQLSEQARARSAEKQKSVETRAQLCRQLK